MSERPVGFREEMIDTAEGRRFVMSGTRMTDPRDFIALTIAAEAAELSIQEYMHRAAIERAWQDLGPEGPEAIDAAFAKHFAGRQR